MSTTPFPGDAIVSYGVLKRASAAFTPQATLVSVMSLFALIEAVVLYERLWYLPFGDGEFKSVGSLRAWQALSGRRLVATLDEALFDPAARVTADAQQRWMRQVLAIGHVPAYRHIAPQALLTNTFHHALNGAVWAYDGAREDGEVFTADGLQRWRDHVAGVGFDAAAEEANDGDDEGRFMNWESTSIYLARASVVRALDADFVGDALEGPIVQLGEAVANRNFAAQLYAKMSATYRANVQALLDDGFIEAMPIPPIAALALQRSDGGIESLLACTEELRGEFAPFRAKYAAYAELMRHPVNMSVQQLMATRNEALDEVGAALDRLKQPRSDARLISEAVSATLKPAAGGAGVVDISPSLSLASLLKFALSRYKLSRIQGRAQILFDTYTKATQLKNVHSLIGKRLGVGLRQHDFDAYSAYAQAVESFAPVKRPPV